MEGAATRSGRALNDKIYIDECLSVALVAVAKTKGFLAEYGPYIGKGGWQDWNIVPFAIDNNYIIATNNRRHFLRELLKHNLHNGLIVIVPAVERADQIALFSNALDAVIKLGDEVVNKVIEVLIDGSVHVRGWSADDHDIGHISNPDWGRRCGEKFLLYRYVSAQTSRNFLPYGKNRSRSPRSQAARISGVVMSQSGRIRRVTSRRSDHKSDIDGRPQYQ